MNWGKSTGFKGFWLFAGLIIILILVLLWWEQEAISAGDESLSISYSHLPGEYNEDVYLAINSTSPDAAVFFTLDGRVPDQENGQLFTKPIYLAADPAQVVVVRSIAIAPNGEIGPVSSGTYFMGLDTDLAKLSIIADPDDLWGEEDGIYVNHSERGRDWERPVDLTFVTGDGKSAFNLGAGLRIHGEWTRWFSDKKSLRLYFREDYGEKKLKYPIFGEEGQTTFDKLILHNSDKDLLLFKNQLTDRLADGIGVMSSRSVPILLFLNGQPWGIYNIREPVDQRFFSENHGVPQAVISDTPNNINKQVAEGRIDDLQHWEKFMQFVSENDLSDPDNYAWLQTQIDLENLVDYYLLEMYVANTDWPHHNVHQFRPETQGGRWQWIVWDNNETFDSVDRQMVQHVLDTQHPLGERMELLLTKLLENQGFRNLFITRAADLLNTSLSTAVVQSEVDMLVDQFDRDVHFERNRWNIAENWQGAVDHISNFAAERPDKMRQHFIDTLELNGTSSLTFNQDEELPGWIVVNDSKPQPLPFSGVYFQDSDIQIRAIPPHGYIFSGWVGLPNDVNASEETITLQVEGDLSISPRFEPISPERPNAGDVSIQTYHVDDGGDIEGDWIELRVNREGGIDMRGWRLTDNDHILATDEGSIIFKDDPLFKNFPEGSIIQVIATQSKDNNENFSQDGWRDGILTLYVGNDLLDTDSDPWFNLGRQDSLLLLAPGPSEDWADDIPIDLWSENGVVNRASFGLPPQNDS